jgi:hypothetical protein
MIERLVICGQDPAHFSCNNRHCSHMYKPWFWPKMPADADSGLSATHCTCNALFDCARRRSIPGGIRCYHRHQVQQGSPANQTNFNVKPHGDACRSLCGSTWLLQYSFLPGFYILVAKARTNSQALSTRHRESRERSRTSRRSANESIL